MVKTTGLQKLTKQLLGKGGVTLDGLPDHGRAITPDNVQHFV